jgi:hypothetical protein
MRFHKISALYTVDFHLKSHMLILGMRMSLFRFKRNSPRDILKESLTLVMTQNLLSTIFNSLNKQSLYFVG